MEKKNKRIMIAIRVDETLHARMKTYAAKNRTTMQDMLYKLIIEELEANENKPFKEKGRKKEKQTE